MVLAPSNANPSLGGSLTAHLDLAAAASSPAPAHCPVLTRETWLSLSPLLQMRVLQSLACSSPTPPVRAQPSDTSRQGSGSVTTLGIAR